MIVGPRGLEWHTTIFTAAPATPTQTTMDAMIFDSTGPVISAGGNTKNTDGSSAGSSVPGSVHAAGYTNSHNGLSFNDTFAAAFHTYKIVWTPQWTAWMVDLQVYRNISFSIWRPQSIRQILRTNVGDSADAAPASGPWCANAAGNAGSVGALQCVNYGVNRPDAHVFIRRIRYTPLSATAVNDALTNTSMFAKYGAMPPPPASVSTPQSVSVAISGGPNAASGRRLLQAPPATAAALSATLAASVPGMNPSDVTITAPPTFAIGGYIAITDPTGFLSPTTWTVPLQQSFLAGMDSDITPSVDQITIQSVNPLLQTQQCDSDANSPLPNCPLAGAFANSYVNLAGTTLSAAGVIVEFTIAGYPTLALAQADLNSLNDDSGSGFASTAAAMSPVEATLLASYSAATAAANDPSATLFSQAFSSVGPSTFSISLLDQNSAPMYAPTIYSVYSVQISADPTTSSLVNGFISNGLTSPGAAALGVSTMPPSRNVALSEDTVCPAPPRTWSQAYFAVAIAFIVISGVETFMLVGIFARRTMKVHARDVVGLTKRFQEEHADMAKSPVAAASPGTRGAVLSEMSEQQAV